MAKKRKNKPTKLIIDGEVIHPDSIGVDQPGNGVSLAYILWKAATYYVKAVIWFWGFLFVTSALGTSYEDRYAATKRANEELSRPIAYFTGSTINSWAEVVASTIFGSIDDAPDRESAFSVEYAERLNVFGPPKQIIDTQNYRSFSVTSARVLLGINAEGLRDIIRANRAFFSDSAIKSYMTQLQYLGIVREFNVPPIGSPDEREAYVGLDKEISVRDVRRKPVTCSGNTCSQFFEVDIRIADFGNLNTDYRETVAKYQHIFDKARTDSSYGTPIIKKVIFQIAD